MFKAKCEICGKEYDNYMRTFYIQYSDNDNDRKCCCSVCKCNEIISKPYKFTNYIPDFVDGGNLITRLFDTKDDLVKWLNKTYNNENEELCCSDSGTIVIVDKKKRQWRIEGFSNLKKGDLPDWEETVIKYHKSI